MFSPIRLTPSTQHVPTSRLAKDLPTARASLLRYKALKQEAQHAHLPKTLASFLDAQQWDHRHLQPPRLFLDELDAAWSDDESGSSYTHEHPELEWESEPFPDDLDILDYLEDLVTEQEGMREMAEAEDMNQLMDRGRKNLELSDCRSFSPQSATCDLAPTSCSSNLAPFPPAPETAPLQSTLPLSSRSCVASISPSGAPACFQGQEFREKKAKSATR